MKEKSSLYKKRNWLLKKIESRERDLLKYKQDLKELNRQIYKIENPIKFEDKK